MKQSQNQTPPVNQQVVMNGVSAILSNVIATGSSPSSYYGGITNDLTRRANEHNAQQGFAFNAHTAANAREIEKQLHSYGMQGGSGGGDDSSNIVYAYPVIPTTRR